MFNNSKDNKTNSKNNKTNYSEPDQDLVTFLKQNQPIMPPPPAHLEAAIMAQTAREKHQKIAPKKAGLAGLIVATLATAVGLIVFNQSQPTQTAFNEAEIKSIEKSLLNNWHQGDEEFVSSYSLINPASNSATSYE